MENLISKKKFRFRRIWSWKKSIGFGFGEFGLEKKYRFWFWKIWSRYRFRSKFWYRHSVVGSHRKHCRCNVNIVSIVNSVKIVGTIVIIV